MIADEIGQKLHDRETRGDILSAEEQRLLQGWYSQLDQEESAKLSAAPSPGGLANLQSRVQQATAQVVEQAHHIEALTAENARLRQEIASLQQMLTTKLTGQPA